VDVEVRSLQPKRRRGCDRQCADVHAGQRILCRRPLWSDVEPGHEQQVVDEPRRPLTVADDLHELRLTIRARRVLSENPLGAGDHRGERRAQVVRRVREELAHPVLGRECLRFGRLERIQHAVEGDRGTPEVGVGAGRAQPTSARAVTDPLRQRRHAVERGERDPDHPDQDQPGDEQHRKPRDDLGVAQNPQCVRDIRVACLQREGPAADRQLHGQPIALPGHVEAGRRGVVRWPAARATGARPANSRPAVARCHRSLPADGHIPAGGHETGRASRRR